MTPPTYPPAGWYPDPTNRAAQRRWDGNAWTSETRPATGPVFPSVAPPTAPAGRSWWKRWWVAAAAVVAILLVIAGISSGTNPSPNASGPAAASDTPTHASNPTPTVKPSPSRAAVPRLVGEDRATANHAIAALGLKVGQVRTRPSLKSPGTVLVQVPPAGVRRAPGSRVTLVVAGLPPRIPPVIGESATAAEYRLESAGFNYSTSSQTVRSGASGVVLSEGPSSGTRAMPGSRVRLVISHLVLPPPPPPPPPPAPARTPTPQPQPVSCTRTSSGTCIRGGEFCPQSSYGMTGIDADGRRYTCTGDTTHPHWE